MPAQQLDEFMRAIQAQESGGRPDVANERTGAHGLFQILPSNWRPWAQEAGLSASAPKTPENQRRIARHKMSQYYDRYGDWDLVAAAWFGGPGAANRLKEGDTSVLGRSDGNMTIGEYIEKMNRGMGGTANGSQQAGDLGVPDAVDPGRMWQTILASLADKAAGGQRERLDVQPFGSLTGASQDPGLGTINETRDRWDTRDPIAQQVEGTTEGAESAVAGAPVAASDSPLPDLGNVQPGKGGVPEGLQENAARGAAAVRKVFNFRGTIGGLGQRANKSDHPDGNAIDVMTGDNTELGRSIAEWFVRNRDKLGVKYVIFARQIWSPKKGWAPRRMADRGSPTANHMDHPHVSFESG